MPRRIRQGGTKMPMKDKVKQDMTSDNAYKTINPKTTGKPRKAVLTVEEKDLPELETLELVIDDKIISLPKPKEMKTGGRASFRGGGMCKKGMNKKARGVNS